MSRKTTHIGYTLQNMFETDNSLWKYTTEFLLQVFSLLTNVFNK